MLSREQQEEIIAVGLLAVALFLLLSLIPTSVFGVPAEQWFPSGNLMGLVGNRLSAVLLSFSGSTSVLVPMLIAAGGFHAGGWLKRDLGLRLAVLGAGLIILVPIGLNVLGQPPEVVGWLGMVVGPPIEGALGFLGSMLLLGMLVVVLSVGTLGWNPIRTMFAGAARGGRAAKRVGGQVGEAAQGVAGIVSGAAQDVSGQLQGHFADRKVAREARAIADAAEAAMAAELASTLEEEVPFAAGPVVVDEPDPPVEDSPAEDAGDDPDDDSELEELPDPRSHAELSETGLPPIELLALRDTGDREEMEAELQDLGEILVEKLRTFGVECTLAGRTTGPVVTQFEVVPAAGVKVNKIANLDADLALALRAESVRIVAPIPGKGAVGVEIPNPTPEVVSIREMLESRAFQRSKAVMPLALGKDLTGRPYVTDLAKMPHGLIAGATGSGKSVCLNTIITSLIYKHTPETLRLLLIDPKMVELSAYRDLPHLRHPVVTDPRDAAGVLKWAVFEMEKRYALLSANGVRSIAEFNERVDQGVTLRRIHTDENDEGDPDRWIYSGGKLPYVVVVVDELADLMMTVQSEVEKPLTLLAQKARAIGIHLIVATQRPSVNVITGLIKANFPCRMAFRVASKTDSRTILDQNGADALLGNGDMLFLPPAKSEPVRAQGAFISTQETDRITGWYRAQAEARAAAEIAEASDHQDDGPDEMDILEEIRSHELTQAADAALSDDATSDWDELFRAAAEVCISHDQGSTSLLQRRLKIGYGRAARIVDQLYDAGVLGPPEGSKAREVRIDMGELDAICSNHGL